MRHDLLIVYSLVILFAAVMLLLFVRALVRLSKTKTGLSERDSSTVGFVVDTFHDLVSRLKDKERELEELRKRAEDRATAIEGYNENILQSVQSGVISFDEELRLTKINLAAARILELKGETVIGKPYAEVLSRPLSDVVGAKKPVERGETSYTTPSGKRLRLGLALSPLRDGEGKTIGQLLIFSDLTHLRAIEAQIALRDKLSSLGEISAGIAHELRNPMAVIAGYTKLLAKRVEESLRPTVDAISKEIAVMDRIISDFLSFARPLELSLSAIDLKTVVNECVAAALSKRDMITVQVGIDELPPLRADEVLMRQALLNLIENALESMPRGGTLAIHASLADGGAVEIAVSDTGYGISEDLRDKIFMPFFTTKEKGTGLGLAIVHKIVVSHGGTIQVESSGMGTTFRLRLPFKDR